MSATMTAIVRCDHDDCREQVVALPDESAYDLRLRARRDRGWRYSSPTPGRHIDLCRWHA